MLYRKIPKTGDRLSILGFGLMRLPQKRGTPGDGRIDEKKAARLVLSALDRGVNYLDTALPYHRGHSEPFLGRILTRETREKTRIATKLTPWFVHRPADMDRILNRQLASLGTECVDYYLLHALAARNWEKMLKMGVLEFLDKAKKQGKIVNTGFSFHGDLETFKKIVDAYDWTLCQIQYNFLDQLNQAGTEGLLYAAKKNLGVVVMEPLRGGNLAGRVPKEVANLWHRAETKRTPVEWALRWIWNHPQVTVVLSGMNTMAQIDENIRIAGKALPDALTARELALVDLAEKTYRGLMKAGCTGCRYCMPCPHGVDIPDCFDIFNRYHMFKDAKTAKLFYLARLSGAFGTPPAHAGLCTQCKRCEALCPQGLPISDLLKEVNAAFSGKDMKLFALLLKGFFLVQRFSRGKLFGRNSRR